MRTSELYVHRCASEERTEMTSVTDSLPAAVGLEAAADVGAHDDNRCATGHVRLVTWKGCPQWHVAVLCNAVGPPCCGHLGTGLLLGGLDVLLVCGCDFLGCVQL